MNSLITKAEGASTLSAGGFDWHQADADIMSDAAIVPIMSQSSAYSSSRVKGIASDGTAYPTAIFAPNIGAPTSPPSGWRAADLTVVPAGSH